MSDTDFPPAGTLRTVRALRSTLVVSGLGYASQALSLMAIPLFLHTVGAEAYGLMVTVMAFMGYLGFADAGLSWGSMILIAQAQGHGDRAAIAHIVRHSAVLAVGSGLLAMLALGAVLAAATAGWRLPMFARHPEADALLLIAGVQLVLNLQFGIVYNLFQGLQEAYWAGVYQGLGRLLGLVGAMVVAWTGGSVAGMLLVQLVCSVATGCGALLQAWRRHPWAFQQGIWTDRTQYARQLRIGVKNLLLQVGRTLGGSAPTLGISAILGPAMVPFYTIPTTLFSLCLTPINTWSASMQSAYGEATAAGATDWVRAAFRRTLERSLVASCLGAALFLVLADPFVRLWTQGRISVSGAMGLSIVVIGVLGAFLQAGQYLLVGLNRHRAVAFAEIISGLMALGLVPLAVNQLGAGAVGLAMLLAALPTSLWVLSRQVQACLGGTVLPRLITTAKAMLVGLVAAGLAAGVNHAVSAESQWVGLVAAGVAGLVGFGLAGWLARLPDIARMGEWLRSRLRPVETVREA